MLTNELIFTSLTEIQHYGWSEQENKLWFSDEGQRETCAPALCLPSDKAICSSGFVLHCTPLFYFPTIPKVWRHLMCYLLLLAFFNGGLKRCSLWKESKMGELCRCPLVKYIWSQTLLESTPPQALRGANKKMGRGSKANGSTWQMTLLESWAEPRRGAQARCSKMRLWQKDAADSCWLWFSYEEHGASAQPRPGVASARRTPCWSTLIAHGVLYSVCVQSSGTAPPSHALCRALTQLA